VVQKPDNKGAYLQTLFTGIEQASAVPRGLRRLLHLLALPHEKLKHFGLSTSAKHFFSLSSLLEPDYHGQLGGVVLADGFSNETGQVQDPEPQVQDPEPSRFLTRFIALTLDIYKTKRHGLLSGKVFIVSWGLVEMYDVTTLEDLSRSFHAGLSLSGLDPEEYYAMLGVPCSDDDAALDAEDLLGEPVGEKSSLGLSVALMVYGAVTGQSVESGRWAIATGRVNRAGELLAIGELKAKTNGMPRGENDVFLAPSANRSAEEPGYSGVTYVDSLAEAITAIGWQLPLQRYNKHFVESHHILMHDVARAMDRERFEIDLSKLDDSEKVLPLRLGRAADLTYNNHDAVEAVAFSELLKPSNKLSVIMAGPGHGKTTLLHVEAMLAALRLETTPGVGPTPVLLALSDIVVGKTPCELLVDAVCLLKDWKVAYSHLPDKGKRLAETALTTGQLAIFIDAGPLAPSESRVQALLEAKQVFPLSPIILVSRPFAVEDERVAHYELLNLREGDISRHLALHASDAHLNLLRSHAALAEQLRNPLLLRLYLSAEIRGESELQTVFDIYAAALEGLWRAGVHRAQLRQENGEIPTVPPAVTSLSTQKLFALRELDLDKPLLQSLAMKMMEQDKRVTKDEAITLLDALCKKRHLPRDVSGETLVPFLVDDVGVLVKQGEHLVFLHDSFTEFLAALELRRCAGGDLSVLNPYLLRPEWTQVIFNVVELSLMQGAARARRDVARSGARGGLDRKPLGGHIGTPPSVSGVLAGELESALREKSTDEVQRLRIVIGPDDVLTARVAGTWEQQVTLASVGASAVYSDTTGFLKAALAALRSDAIGEDVAVGATGERVRLRARIANVEDRITALERGLPALLSSMEDFGGRRAGGDVWLTECISRFLCLYQFDLLGSFVNPLAERGEAWPLHRDDMARFWSAIGFYPNKEASTCFILGLSMQDTRCDHFAALTASEGGKMADWGRFVLPLSELRHGSAAIWNAVHAQGEAAFLLDHLRRGYEAWWLLVLPQLVNYWSHDWSSTKPPVIGPVDPESYRVVCP